MEKDTIAFMSGEYSDIEVLSQYLESQGIKTDGGWFIGNKLIYVAKKDYKKALYLGSQFVMDMNANENKGFAICWVNQNVRMHNIYTLAVETLEANKKGEEISKEKLIELGNNPCEEDGFSIQQIINFVNNKKKDENGEEPPQKI